MKKCSLGMTACAFIFFSKTLIMNARANDKSGQVTHGVETKIPTLQQTTV